MAANASQTLEELLAPLSKLPLRELSCLFDGEQTSFANNIDEAISVSAEKSTKKYSREPEFLPNNALRIDSNLEKHRFPLSPEDERAPDILSKETQDEADFAAACKKQAPNAIAVVKELMASSSNDRVRLAAAQYIIDRAWGPLPQRFGQLDIDMEALPSNGPDLDTI